MAKHVWATDDNGEVDHFGMDYGFHNGPSCTVCGHSFCEHCADDWETECPGPPPEPMPWERFVSITEAEYLALKEVARG